jgi:hypothetical protein
VTFRLRLDIIDSFGSGFKRKLAEVVEFQPGKAGGGSSTGSRSCQVMDAVDSTRLAGSP